jgi:hypothetical protein
MANLALWDIEASLKCWRDLEAEATVSCKSLTVFLLLRVFFEKISFISGQSLFTRTAWRYAC